MISIILTLLTLIHVNYGYDCPDGSTVESGLCPAAPICLHNTQCLGFLGLHVGEVPSLRQRLYTYDWDMETHTNNQLFQYEPETKRIHVLAEPSYTHDGTTKPWVLQSNQNYALLSAVQTDERIDPIYGGDGWISFEWDVGVGWGNIQSSGSNQCLHVVRSDYDANKDVGLVQMYECGPTRINQLFLWGGGKLFDSGLVCPPGTHSVVDVDNGFNDIAGCGLDTCLDRHGFNNVNQCRDHCVECHVHCFYNSGSHAPCNAFSWSPIGGDQPDITTCTMYTSTGPTRNWVGDKQIMCALDLPVLLGQIDSPHNSPDSSPFNILFSSSWLSYIAGVLSSLMLVGVYIMYKVNCKRKNAQYGIVKTESTTDEDEIRQMIQ